MINGAAVKFSELLDTFYDKANDVKLPLEQRLNFILRLTNQYDDIKMQLSPFAKEFMSIEKKNKVVAKVPLQLKFKENNLRRLIISHIATINETQTKDIKKIYSYICAEFEYEISPEYEDVFQQWRKSPANETHIRQVKSEIRDMAKTFTKFHDRFISDMHLVDEVRTKLKKFINLSKNCCNAILEAKTIDETTSLSFNAMSLLNEVIQLHTKLIEKIKQILSTLKLYNQQRVVFVNFLLGRISTLKPKKKEQEKNK